jgi:hypothetical protein
MLSIMSCTPARSCGSMSSIIVAPRCDENVFESRETATTSA